MPQTTLPNTHTPSQFALATGPDGFRIMAVWSSKVKVYELNSLFSSGGGYHTTHRQHDPLSKPDAQPTHHTIHYHWGFSQNTTAAGEDFTT